MSGFNLSEWALRHRSLVVYFMLVLAVAGVGSYLRARAQRGPGLHDPDHGGAGQLARRHGRRHAPAGHRAPRAQAPGDAEPRLPAQLHERGPDHDLRQPEGLDAGQARSRTSGTRSARRSATSATPCRRASSGPASTTSSATPTASSTASPRTASPTASCATTSRTCARACCRCRTSPRSTSWARRTSEIYVEFSTEQLAGLGIDRQALIAALQAQNAVTPAGVVQTGDEKLLIRVTGCVPRPSRTSSASTSSPTAA